MFATSVAVLLCAAPLLGLTEQPGTGGRRGGQQQPEPGKGGRGMLAQMSTFQTEVPAHPFDVVLVNPTETSITASIIASVDSEGFIEFGEASDGPSRSTPHQNLRAGEPALFVLNNLRPDTAYRYTWRHRSHATPPAGQFDASPEYTFRTRRARGGSFAFTVQADSHLDPNMTPAVYQRALANALADKPDFHIDLGDTFMTDKRRDFHDAIPQYVAQRYYFGQLCHSAPLFMVLGNHDGEFGHAGFGPDQMAGWSFTQRTRYFPPPAIEARGMYSGRTSRSNGPDATGANYYAFEWGDALIAVLDPFSSTRSRMRGVGGVGGVGGGGGGGGAEAETMLTDQSWTLTLGREQYDWLDSTLAASKAPFKFAFIHHLVGGRGKSSRGGVESAPYFEWGGKNADGSDGFADHRPGWPMPIHQMLVKRGVSAVFHGHDHLFVHAQLDGIVYQCVPQPGNVRGGTRSAEEYGYKSGTILGSPGHLRVSVSADQARVSFIRSAAQDAPTSRRAGDEANGAVMNEYTMVATKDHK
ncbi:MAG: fibronectin type III domain-containing protein [Planctomycetes bacterium]|nr:fibronectin type III domain-containing protein [Planctomycetota bacterium]